MTFANQSRRQLFGSLLLSSVAAPMVFTSRAQADTDPENGFTFEVTRSDAEWRSSLSDLEFEILRGGGTEQRKSSPLWEETRNGSYTCKACDLTLFDAYWKTVLDIGWVFFRQSDPHSILTAIDRSPYEDLLAGAETTMAPVLTAQELRELDTLAGVEAKCRRCGSHLGHIISYSGVVLYCINGAALGFLPTET